MFCLKIDLPAGNDAQIAPDGPWYGVCRHGCSHHSPHSLDDPRGPGPDHRDNRSRGHVFNQTWVEWPVGKVRIVSGKQVSRCLKKTVYQIQRPRPYQGTPWTSLTPWFRPQMPLGPKPPLPIDY